MLNSINQKLVFAQKSPFAAAYVLGMMHQERKHLVQHLASAKTAKSDIKEQIENLEDEELVERGGTVMLQIKKDIETTEADIVVLNSSISQIEQMFSSSNVEIPEL